MEMENSVVGLVEFFAVSTNLVVKIELFDCFAIVEQSQLLLGRDQC